jgi:hypothetical protein
LSVTTLASSGPARAATRPLSIVHLGEIMNDFSANLPILG